ncbi:MAG: hypothetical protein R2729_01580 [Bryobacteraceae bacterium]
MALGTEDRLAAIHGGDEPGGIVAVGGERVLEEFLLPASSYGLMGTPSRVHWESCESKIIG